MPKVCPDDQAEMAKCYRLVILDEECLASCRARRRQVLRGEHMGIGDVADMCDIPQIVAISNDEWSLIFGDACMNRWN